jgi:gamma-glutamylcyclotransferase (GGCT)/AIG2-like uncharacterized protein YtfP
MKYKLNKYEEYYFAYGSNMNNLRLYDRIGRFVENTNGILPNYKLVFNKKTSANDFSYANIQQDKNSNVYGKIYKLTNSELKLLDKDEGIEENKVGYKRKKFKVYDSDNKKYIQAYTYIAKDKSTLSNTLQPSERYKEYFYNSDLPNNYIESLSLE